MAYISVSSVKMTHLFIYLFTYLFIYLLIYSATSISRSAREWEKSSVVWTGETNV